MSKFKAPLCPALALVLVLSACSSGGGEVGPAAEITPGLYEIKFQAKGIMGMLEGPGSGPKAGKRCISPEQAADLSGTVLENLFRADLECEVTVADNGAGMYSGKRTCVTPQDDRSGSASITMDYTGKSRAQSFRFDVQTAMSSQMPEGKFKSKVSTITSGKRIGDCDDQVVEEPAPTEQDEASSDENSEAIDAAEAAAESAADSSGNEDF